ncbi:hypothetical protein GS682_28910 [Nostoc sp. B(2019)]|nr:hypothetical protein [Nostoc sp. B(2019)]
MTKPEIITFNSNLTQQDLPYEKLRNNPALPGRDSAFRVWVLESTPENDIWQQLETIYSWVGI